MSKVTVWFLRCAMIYFVIGVLIGLEMVISPQKMTNIPIHVHFNLLGWMSMMIYGVAYHILPRFSGKPLYSERMAEAHLWLGNIGLIGMVIFWAIYNKKLLFVFSLIEVISILLFVYNMFRTVRPIVMPMPGQTNK